MKASDISTEQVLAAIRATRGRHGVPHWATLWDVQAELAAYPSRVVLAKMKGLVKKGVIGGCACGCRGDFEIPGESPRGLS